MGFIYKEGLFPFFGIMAFVMAAISVQPSAFASPQFSRRYNTSCSTCHTVYPKLNDLGKAFLDAGFEFPDRDQLLIETPQALLAVSAPPLASRKVSKQMLGVIERSQIADPETHALQETYLGSLELIAQELKSHGFPYRFCLGPVALDEEVQRCPHQHTIRFGRLNGENVVEITGVYYASYSRKHMAANQRSQKTFRDVILPILKVAVPQFQDNPEIRGYAIEVSHYVRGKVLGVSLESPENLAVVLPSAAARNLIDSKDAHAQQIFLREGEIFLNAKPFSLDLNSITAPDASRIP
jgi:hypothetical protein